MFAGDQVVLGANPLLAVNPLEPSHREMPAGYVLKVFYERVVHRGATEGADHGKCLRSYLCVTTNPKRAATWVTNFRRIGAPSLMTPRSATKRAASVTVLASMLRTAK